jgi:vacuolar-type H+-ATPase subunit I/STV1
MRSSTFKFCMLFAGVTLLAVATYFFVTYVGVKIALDNNGLRPFYQQSIRALWLTFGFQALLIGVLYFIVAYRPHAVTREVIVIFGLIQLVEGVLMLAFSGSWVAASLLGVAALCVLVAAMIWPEKAEVEIGYGAAAPPAPAASTPASAPGPVTLP